MKSEFKVLILIETEENSRISLFLKCGFNGMSERNEMFSVWSFHLDPLSTRTDVTLIRALAVREYSYLSK